MKILSISAQKPDSTGSGVYLAEMVKALSRLGHEQAVIAGVTRSDVVKLAKGVKFYPVYYSSEKLPYPVLGMSDEMPYESTRYRDMTSTMVEQLRSAYAEVIDWVEKDFKPDLIICHHLYLVTSIVRETLPDKTVVAISHGTDLRQMMKHNLEREAIISAIGSLDAIYALHAEQKEEIAEIYGVGSERIQVIGAGYNHELFHCERQGGQQENSARLDEQASETKPHRLIYVGKIWTKKGVRNLIKALEHLPYKPRELEVSLVGGHSHEAELQSIQVLAGLSRYDIVFHGKLPQEEVASLYCESDVFILPSFFEGLPLVVIEALACGCKVVMTDLPGIRPWLNEKIPQAPIWFVKPPRMVNVDEPDPDDLPLFEQNLATALEQAFEARPGEVDMHALTWDALCEQILSTML